MSGLSVETLFGNLNPDQIIADEQVDTSPPPSTLGKRPSLPREIDNNSSDGGEDDDPPGPEGGGSRGLSSPGTQTNSGSLQVEQVTRRMTK